jgi:hypothetical protein
MLEGTVLRSDPTSRTLRANASFPSLHRVRVVFLFLNVVCVLLDEVDVPPYSGCVCLPARVTYY